MTKQVPTETATELDVNRARSDKMKSNKNARKHGHWALKAALKGIDLRAIDRRTVLGSELARRREQMFADAGGREVISEVKADLIEKYLRSVIFIESIDAYLFQQSSLV